MYKIFFGSKIIVLNNLPDIFLDEQKIIKLKFETEADIYKALEIVKKKNEKYNVLIFSDELEILWQKFQSFFKVIEAAGGLVKNEKEEILFIYRNAKWDLPKGKVEPDENIETAAIREVMEECGVKDLKIVKELSPTFHCYELGGALILKKTHWFEMLSKGNNPLVPQIEEGITTVKWLNKKDMQKALKNTYQSVKEVLKNG